MPLGAIENRINGNINGQKEYNPTIYSRISFANKDSKIDPTRLQFSHWNGMLKISILPKVPGADEYSFKDSVALHLSVPKAYILIKEIEHYQNDRNEGRDTNFFYGVNTPKGLVGIIMGDEFGQARVPLLTIMRLDEDGNVLNSYAYELKGGDFYTSIRNFRQNTKEFEKFAYEDVELELIKMQLSQYVEAMTMSQAFACVEATKFQDNQVFRSLNQIKDKLGIRVDRKSNAGDFFNGNSSAPKMSYDSISDAINGTSSNNTESDENFEIEL